MEARSALFDLYGDHLRTRDGRAPVAALVRMLAPLEIAAPAVRTAVSRMVRQGWLAPTRVASGPGYMITPKAARRLTDAAARIYRTDALTWDGTFELIIIDPATPRSRRMRIGSGLAYLGYGRIGDDTWVAARASAEAAPILAESGVRFDRFAARYAGPGARAAMVARAWDIDELADRYRSFIDDMRRVVGPVATNADARTAFTARFRLVHAWRTFLFRDPSLPAEVLPARWPGTRAAAFFDEHQARLRPGADAFVDECLDGGLLKEAS